MKTIILLTSILMLGFVQYSLALTSDVSLTSPVMVNTSGQKISDFHVGQQIGVESIIKNSGTSEHKFAYLVQVMDSKGRTDFLEGFSASMLPNQSFTASQVWIPKDMGQYTIRVFVWDSLSSAIPLTDALETQILVN